MTPEQQGETKAEEIKETVREEGAVLHGFVKRYNSKNGYGFIATDDGGTDLFVHQSEIQTDGGFRALEEGARVKCIFQTRQGKATAVKVEGESGPLKRFTSRLEASGIHEPGFASLKCPPGQESGTVKWFNIQKGFGFIVKENCDKDIFVHINDTVNNAPLAENMRVFFTEETEESGRLRARTVSSPDPPPALPAYGAQHRLPPHQLGHGNPFHQYQPAAPAYNPYPNQQQTPYYMQQAAPQRSSFYPPNQPAAVPGGGPGGIQSGTVKFFNAAKGFGFIITPLNTELYLGTTGLSDQSMVLSPGDAVEYTEQSNGQKVWATNVKKASGSSSRKRGADDAHDPYPANPFPPKAARQNYQQGSAHFPPPGQQNYGGHPGQNYYNNEAPPQNNFNYQQQHYNGGAPGYDPSQAGYNGGAPGYPDSSHQQGYQPQQGYNPYGHATTPLH